MSDATLCFEGMGEGGDEESGLTCEGAFTAKEQVLGGLEHRRFSEQCAINS